MATEFSPKKKNTNILTSLKRANMKGSFLSLGRKGREQTGIFKCIYKQTPLLILIRNLTKEDNPLSTKNDYFNVKTI